jgi:hypothetical protein
MLNNRGQIAETVTWIVATMIIVVTLTVFIFISVQMSNAKNLSLSGIASTVGSFFISDDVGKIDRSELKTLFALSLNEKNQEKINGWINE